MAAAAAAQHQTLTVHTPHAMRPAATNHLATDDSHTRTRSSSSGVGVARVPQVYAPVEVPLEPPEPAPHNVSADSNHTPDREHDTDRHAGEQQQQQQQCVSHSVGIMRTSLQPTLSVLQGKKPRKSKRTKLKRGGIAPAQCDFAASQPASIVPQSAGESSLPFAFDLPAERDSGNCEYKWKLLDKSADRILHLTTQLAYRLSEGGGQMLYEVGVQDNGYAQGLPEHELDESVGVIARMARTLQCELTVLTRAWGHEGLVAELLVRRVGDVNSFAESASLLSASVSSSALLSPISASASASSSPAPSVSPPPVHGGDLRIALIGQGSSGRSSLLGCLLSNQRDDGRGRSRLHVFRHRHEIENGHTSAIARQILGFDEMGRITNYQVSRKLTLGTSTALAASVAHLAEPTKKEKGLASLFGGGTDDEYSSSDEDDEWSGVGDGDGDGGVPVECAEPEPPVTIQTTLAPLDEPSLALDGADEDGLTSQACSTNDWQRILDHSTRVITFFDLPSEDLKSAIYGLIGPSCPDYCCIVVAPPDAAAAASKASSTSAPLISSLTREQILICCALGIPFLLVISKSDLLDAPTRDRLIRALSQICAEAPLPIGSRPRVPDGAALVTHKIPLVVPASASPGEEQHAELDLLERNSSESLLDADLPPARRADITRAVSGVRAAHGAPVSTPSSSYCYPAHTFVPVFVLSSVTGEGIDVLKRYLFKMRNYRREYWQTRAHTSDPSSASSVPVEFSVDDIFTLDSVGTVVSGTLLAGVIKEGDTLLMGPINAPDSASMSAATTVAAACAAMFRPVLVKSLHISRKSFRNARAGQSVTLALKKVDRALLRRGMVLVSVPPPVPRNTTLIPAPSALWPRSCFGFEAYIRIFDHSPAAATRSSRNGCPAMHAHWHNNTRYQPIVHVGNIRQSAEIVSMRLVTDTREQAQAEEWIATHCQEGVDQAESDEVRQPDLSTILDSVARRAPVSTPLPSQARALHAGSCALVRFEFLYQSEYLRCGRQVLFREERTRGTGVITKLYYLDQQDEIVDSTPNQAASPSLSPSPSPHGSPAPRADSSSPDGPHSPTRTALSPSQSSSPPAWKSKRKKSSASPSAALNVFQRAKEQRRQLMQHEEQAAVALLQTQQAVHPQPTWRVVPHHSDRSPLIAATPQGDSVLPRCALPASHLHTRACFTASVPNTPALCAQASRSMHAVPPVQRGASIRHFSDADSHPPPPSLLLEASCSPENRSSASSIISSAGPPHSASDSNLSAWRLHRLSDAGSSSSFRHPHRQCCSASVDDDRSALATLPLTRILSVDSTHGADLDAHATST